MIHWRRLGRLFFFAAWVLVCSAPLSARFTKPKPHSQTAETKPRFAGLSLSQALKILQKQGLKIIFSSRLVKSDMRVEQEPTASVPRQILQQLLAPHGLVARSGPGDRWVVVKADQKAESGEIRGRILAGPDRQSLAGAHIRIVDHQGSVFSGRDGRFQVRRLPPGFYALEINMSGYLPAHYRLEVGPGRSLEEEFVLQPMPLILEEMEVTPSIISLMSPGVEPTPLLSVQEIDQLPRVTDDVFRAINRMPGISGTDISANFNIRGGDTDEALVLLNGQEIFQPFHLKQLQSVFSVFDSKAIGRVNFLSGGYPAKYGGRMSGVIDLTTAPAEERWMTELGLSLLNRRLLGSDRFAKGRGQWLVSLREGYLDLLRAVEREQIPDEDDPEEMFDFNDGLVYLQFHFSDRLTLAFHWFRVSDTIFMIDEPEDFVPSSLSETEQILLDDEDRYSWLNILWAPNDAIDSRTSLSRGELDRHRQGRQRFGARRDFEVDDRRHFTFLGIKQDWTYAPNQRHFSQFGWGWRQWKGRYDYQSLSFQTSPFAVGNGPPQTYTHAIHKRPEGDEFHVYFSHRFAVSEPFSIELGGRWEQRTYLPRSEQFSPRFHASWQMGPRTVLRGALGRYHQAQGIYELQVEDGIDQFHEAQGADHQVLGFSHRWSDGWRLKVDVYRKRYFDLRARFENPFNPVVLFPESEPERIRIEPEKAISEGFEILVKNPVDRDFTWWASYAYAVAEDEIGGERVPRSWDHRHAFQLGLNQRLGVKWNFNLTGLYHSGLPTTMVEVGEISDESGKSQVVPILGPRNGERIKPFQRLDLRISRRSRFWRGSFEWFVEVINLLNRKNPCCFEYDFFINAEDQATLKVNEKYSMPIIPSFGMTLRF